MMICMMIVLVLQVCHLVCQIKKTNINGTTSTEAELDDEKKTFNNSNNKNGKKPKRKLIHDIRD